jgi:hypothetical protein
MVFLVRALSLSFSQIAHNNKTNQDMSPRQLSTSAIEKYSLPCDCDENNFLNGKKLAVSFSMKLPNYFARKVFMMLI